MIVLRDVILWELLHFLISYQNLDRSKRRNSVGTTTKI
ncbi:hypothetical protein G436_1307 [Leptospira interrogans serovar Hardjo str. Norma]|uniref:Uncharacterized protein n=1 Tax=Leptospira interrogans serovar Hardjo str. Norma TaxID=1279460 RepID=A0A0M5LAT7_LEPIR|nr:hypothetical protein G436_1307 [Leptospira interrogans serovar Hardjo str. Norma]